ncbi:hypothetical protein [Deinococcus hopiensis]|uniref:Uncharacterized protein n=1 Tax=Deinococcus hopiensis KR-140 TaxID=695939 RepID=A0A1W1UNG6_9DEIO|nr:hypothetical protein [Deinococcus hopiensis]SMB82620.1 hypothetical protein SAMN00790413_04088 [Deinococcus hopiensis KR-140]
MARQSVLPGVDRWSAGRTGVKFRQQGHRLIFTLPLNVPARPNRVYTGLNVTGTAVFNSGASKPVCEPLPVRPAN